MYDVLCSCLRLAVPRCICVYCQLAEGLTLGHVIRRCLSGARSRSARRPVIRCLCHIYERKGLELYVSLSCRDSTRGVRPVGLDYDLPESLIPLDSAESRQGDFARTELRVEGQTGECVTSHGRAAHTTRGRTAEQTLRTEKEREICHPRVNLTRNPRPGLSDRKSTIVRCSLNRTFDQKLAG